MEHKEIMGHAVDIVVAHVSNNTVPVGDMSTLIASTYAALAALGGPAAEPEATKPTPAVSVRASLARPDAIVSLIDGRPYKMLRGHIRRHGFTPESYRVAYGLPASYPMTAPAYSDARRALAVKIGLGTRRRG